MACRGTPPATRAITCPKRSCHMGCPGRCDWQVGAVKTDELTQKAGVRLGSVAHVEEALMEPMATCAGGFDTAVGSSAPLTPRPSQVARSKRVRKCGWHGRPRYIAWRQGCTHRWALRVSLARRPAI